MPIATSLTTLLEISHPVLLAPMDVIAGSRLVAAVQAMGEINESLSRQHEVAFTLRVVRSTDACSRCSGVDAVWSKASAAMASNTLMR